MTSRAELLRREINKLVGKEVVDKGSDQKYVVEYMPTGVLPFDIMFGGGIPRGRYVELTGDYSTLKSFLALNTIAQVQRSGGMAALIDTEHAYDKGWAVYLGVNDNDLMLVQPETGEEGVDVMELMIRNQVDFICLDSIAATIPQNEAGKRLSKENIQPGQQAKLMSAALRRLTAVNSRTGLLLINQMREQIGITFGPTEKAPGGRAPGFYASMRVNCRKAGKVTRDVKLTGLEKDTNIKEQIGQTYRMVVEKSKLNRPWREMYFNWDLEQNEIDTTLFLMLQSMDLGVIERTGNTWHFNGVKYMVGSKAAVLKQLRTDAEMRKTLEVAVRTHHGLSLPPGVSAHPKSKVARQSAASSEGLVRGSTLGQARVASSSTVPRKTKLSK